MHTVISVRSMLVPKGVFRPGHTAFSDLFSGVAPMSAEPLRKLILITGAKVSALATVAL